MRLLEEHPEVFCAYHAMAFGRVADDGHKSFQERREATRQIRIRRLRSNR